MAGVIGKREGEGEREGEGGREARLISYPDLSRFGDVEMTVGDLGTRLRRGKTREDWADYAGHAGYQQLV